MRLFPHEGREETAAATRNRIPRPAMVLVGEKGHRLIIRRETLEDLVRNDLD